MIEWSTLKKLIWLKATALASAIRTYTGTLVSFLCSKSSPMLSLVCSISPVQSLNGYDAPWPAGGGVNKFDASTVSSENYYIISTTGDRGAPGTAGVEWRYSAYIPVTPGDVLYFGEVNASASSAGTAFYSHKNVGDYISGFTATQLANASNVWTVPEGAAYMRHSFRIDSGYNENWQSTVFIVKNSDPHEWTPYENICPISGYNGVTVYEAGECFFDAPDSNGTNGGINFAVSNGKHLTLKGTTGANTAVYAITLTKPFTVKAGETLSAFLQGKIKRTGGNFGFRLQNANNNNIGGLTYSSIERNYIATWTATEDTEITKFECRVGASHTFDCDVNVIAYIGDANNIPIQFPNPPGTVYGGSVDLVSGVLTVDKAVANMGDLSWTKNSQDFFQTSKSALPNGAAASSGTIICSAYPQGATGNTKYMTQTGSYVRVWDDSYADADAFKTGVTGQTFVYTLATPVTYQLTPQEISTLVGQNNVWQESGDNLSVTFKG